MPITARKPVKQRSGYHVAGCRPLGFEQAIRLRQAELDRPVSAYHSPRLLTRPTFWGGVATAMDFLGVLSDYDTSPLTVKEQEAEIEQYFADAFVHFGRAFTCAAAQIGPLAPRK